MIEMDVIRERRAVTVNHNPIFTINIYADLKKRYLKIAKAFKSFSAFCDTAVLRWIEAENGKHPSTGYTGEKKMIRTVCFSPFQFDWLKPALNRSAEMNTILAWYLDLMEPVYFVESKAVPKACLDHKDIPVDVVAQCVKNGQKWVQK